MTERFDAIILGSGNAGMAAAGALRAAGKAIAMVESWDVGGTCPLRVYVAGDVLWSSAQLSPLASHEGRVVAGNILNGDTATPDCDTVPSAVYAVPALASAGLTGEDARARGLDFAVKTNDLTGWRSSQTHAESAAFSKVLIEAGTDRILGAHIVAHGAEEIIHLFAFAMKHGITAQGLGESVYAYPTFASDIKHML